ncbi:hypothetical protein QMZ25_16900 [Stenotrophomonas sp. RS-48]|uniref:phage neck terminator protein n=1 Tax=Stenotrophomonas sp. RS-48 TaxID=3043300 RepID=UPI0024B5BF18|nr:hypothetical protein [Stenotrophomonas sp. RS-48]MDI9250281.1 hypothetical protein [Stenotrophomonas sp. RS-48]
MIEDEIRALIAKATTLQVIFANQNGPRPKLPYITVRVDTAPRAPLLEADLSDDGNQTYAAHRDATVELQCFGDGSFDALDDLSQRLKGPYMVAAGYAANIAVYATDSVQNIPVLRDGAKYEPRAVLDIGIRYTKQHDEEVGLIKTVQGEMTLQDHGTDLVDTFDATSAT